MRSLAATVLEAASALPPEPAVLLVAALPVLELRGALPLGIAMGLPVWDALLLAVVGNLLPVPILLWALSPLGRFLHERTRWGGCMAWLERRGRDQGRLIQRFGWWGLVLLVAVPLPGTGAWTGALVASVFHIPFRSAVAAIAFGVVVAGWIVLALTLSGRFLLGG